MKIIVTIARNELKIMFYSPIAWLMLIIFIVQSGLFFGDIVENIATTVAATGRNISFLSYIFFNVQHVRVIPQGAAIPLFVHTVAHHGVDEQGSGRRIHQVVILLPHR